VAGDAVAFVRSLLAVFAVLPGLLAGFVVTLVTLSRRRGLNATLAVWGRLGTAAAGISFDIQGADHLESARPAVFVFNHQSTVDPLMITALIRHDFVGIAKKEMRRNVFFGPAFAWAGVVFIDRFHHARALEQLKPAVVALAAGYSVVVAPEGTRGIDGSIGRFKKGAFHLAMQAGRPVVPVVLLNSRAVMPRGGRLIRAATVRVVVHEPIATDAWSEETLDREVNNIEELFRSTVGQRYSIN
jgi:putative phosphoserine phosphatase/1-acylglycerol-3-phosphate O-acyltransferase